MDFIRKKLVSLQLLYKAVKQEEVWADKMERTRQKCDVVSYQHNKNTDAKLAHYRMLAKKDDSDLTQIIGNFGKIIQCMRQIEEIKMDLNMLERKHQEETYRLRVQRNRISKKIQNQQLQITCNNVNDRKQLGILIRVSNNIIKVSKI